MSGALAKDLSATALLLIDNQKALLHPTYLYYGRTRSNAAYESNFSALLKAFRTKKTGSSNGPFIVHVFHKSTNPASPLYGGPATEPLPIAEPEADEPVVWKTVNSAFIGTDLEARLRERGIRRLVVAGITTDHCVSTSVRMAANLGVTDWVDEAGVTQKGEVILVEDATFAFEHGEFDADTVHKVNVETLRGEFAEIVTTKEMIERIAQ